MTPVERQQLKNAVMTVLHASGGPLQKENGGQRVNAGMAGDTVSPKNSRRPVLEMTLVVDCCFLREEATGECAEVIGILKQTDEIFRNVRMNVVYWLADGLIRREVTSAALLQLGRPFDGYEQRVEKKRLEVLLAYLKKYDARSRLLILATEGNYIIEDFQLLQESLYPFLYRRILLKEPDRICTGRQLLSENRVMQP